MRVFAIALAFSLMLATGVLYTQVAAQGAKPAAPAPATQKPPAPAAPAPTQKPPAPAAPAAPAPPPAKFQDGMKYAYVNMQVIASQSAEGRAAAEKLKAAQET